MNIKILLLLNIIVFCLIFGGIRREKLEMKKKKVAIGICGQPRTFQKCYQSLYDNVINCNTDYEFDIYLVTWDKDYNEHKVELEECYPNHEKILLTNEDKENIDKKPENICNLHKSEKYYITQLYQWQKFINNINSKYDIIMKTRFDINLLHKINFNNINNNNILTSNSGATKYNVDDQVVIGNINNMKYMLNILDDKLELDRDVSKHFNEEINLETLLGFIFTKYNIKVENIKYKIIR